MIILRDTLRNIISRPMVSVLAALVLVVVSNFAFAMSGFELKEEQMLMSGLWQTSILPKTQRTP